jgi:hypothetical protein
MNELFAMAVWAAFAARISFLAFWGQATKLAPVMKKLRQGLIPATLVMIGFAPFSQAHSMPGHWVSGTPGAEKQAPVVVAFDGISLDQAVNRAERQYRARVVRTDVQDEDGRTVYVLKLLSEDGRVFTVRIDAATGRMR